MDQARQHWKILQGLEKNFADRVKEFLVTGWRGDAVLMVTKPNGEGYWFGKMEFGEESSKEVMEPTRLEVSNLVGMAQGDRHIVLLDGLGQIYTLGMNDEGQLGQGIVDGPIYFTPQLISAYNSQRFIEVRCGYGHSLARTEDGKVCAWGRNDYCQVGLPSLSSSSSEVPSLHQIPGPGDRIVSIECGGFHSLVLTDQGQVYGWGANDLGQLGQTNNHSNSATPVLLSTDTPIIQIAAGFDHTLLLTKDAQVLVCGSNECGELGLPISDTSASSSRLCKVSGLPRITQIASHFATHLSIALSTDRRCFVWGEWNQTSSPIPIELPPIYSTIESPLSFGSNHPNTPHSVRIES